MILDAADFTFEPPKEVAFARRVLIKPSAGYPRPHPVTTSRETLAEVIRGIRRVSSADILILERSLSSEPIHAIYKSLGYDFPRMILLDADQCVPVAVENPLIRPFALTTFWMPNVILSCDFMISIAPCRIVEGKGEFSIKNLLGLLPSDRYMQEHRGFTEIPENADVDSVVADLYFTLPFDLGIIDARKKLVSSGDAYDGVIEDYGKVFVGTPYEADLEASQIIGAETEYLRLIDKARCEQGE
jgi:hypothetical protein